MNTTVRKVDSDLAELFENHFQPQLPVSSIVIEVDVTASDLFKDAAEIYSMEAERVMRYTSNELFQISSDEFLGYFKTLLFLRVSRIRGVSNQTTKAYQHDQRNYLVPAFVSILLTSIGKAQDNDFGFIFMPSMSISANELLSPEEMREISRKLQTLNKEGLTCIETGIAMSPVGELSMMATLNVQGEVLSYKKDHPVYGFYAAFFKHQVLEETIFPGCLRVRYGAEIDYRMYLQHIV